MTTKEIKPYKFEVGDIVICKDNPYNLSYLEVGEYYLVKSIDTMKGDVIVGVHPMAGDIDDGVTNYALIERFELPTLENAPKCEPLPIDYFMEKKEFPTVYEIRKLGKENCQTEGSDHYKGNPDEIEPLEYAVQNGMFEDWAIINIVKYATRFKKSRNIKDLAKVADYAHILCGVEILKEEKK